MKTRNVKHVLLYGALDSDPVNAAGLDHLLEWVGDTYVTGSLYDLSAMPALHDEGDNVYAAKAYRLTGKQSLSVFDNLVGFSRRDKQSRFLRKRVKAPGLGVKAWVYYVNPAFLSENRILVTDASWAEYLLWNGKMEPAYALSMASS